MFIVFFGSVILNASPLNAVQMLWVNLIMDTLGALALATEMPTDEILKRPPYAKNNAIITEIMWRNIFGHSIYQIIVLCVIIFAAPGWLCNEYWTLCLERDANENCILYNPFYTDVEYIVDSTQTYWLDKELSNDDFDQTMLEILSCQNYLKEGNVDDFEGDCNLFWDTHSDYIHSPNNFTYYETTQKLLHYTFVFQIFVLMQLFNIINARKIGEGELNVFTGIFKNGKFILVLIITFSTQYCAV